MRLFTAEKQLTNEVQALGGTKNATQLDRQLSMWDYPIKTGRELCAVKIYST